MSTSRTITLITAYGTYASTSEICPHLTYLFIFVGPETSEASGFIVDPERGLILTNRCVDQVVLAAIQLSDHIIKPLRHPLI